MKNVLVIEHKRMIFLDIKITFAKYNYDVYYGNKHNLELLAKSNIAPDLIILDLASLKFINGLLKFSFTNYLKFKNIPVIITTSNMKPGLKFCLSARLNIIGEVLKPYDPTSLLEYYTDYMPSVNLNSNQIFLAKFSKI